MANNNLVLGRHDGPDIFSDDDPLAELARIVGHEDRSVRPAAQAAAPRREPEFNLEDELTREFERFDAPRLEPVGDFGHAAEPLQVPAAAVEPRGNRAEPVVPVADMPVVSHPAAPQQGFEPGAEQPLQHLPFDLAATAPSMPIRQQASFSHADLVAELESSLRPAPDAGRLVEAPVGANVASSDLPLAARTPEKGYKPGFRMPIANFQRVDLAPRDVRQPVEPVIEPAAAPVAAAPVAELTPTPVVAPAATAGIDNESIWNSLERELTGETAEPVRPQAAANPVDGLAALRAFAPHPEAPNFAAVPSVETPKPAVAETVQPSQPVPEAVQPVPFSQLEELIYDVDHYSKRAPQTEAPHAAPQTAAPQAAAPQSAVASTQSTSLAVNADLFDEDFDLALDDLDLDFSDLSLGDDAAEHASAPVTAQPAALTPVARQAEPVHAAVSYPAARPAAEAPVADAVASSMPAADDDVVQENPDAFDPTLIAEGDEHVETMFDMDVPELPLEEPAVAAKHDADFDIDLDAELASLLQAAPGTAASARGVAAPVAAATPPRQPMSRATPTHVPVAEIAPAAPVAAKSSYDADLDDFERALEEDFRRSLSTPLPNGGRLPNQDDDYAQPVARQPIRWGAPVAVLGVLLMGGISAYAYYASGVPGKAASGKPLVIAADKEPVKIAPENPGGKTVPNQDKAVYERVAGDADGKPRQETLISSNEEPMDVVQRTLTADNLPLQGEEEALTEALDTQDPRLLPQQADAAGAPSAEQPVSVMPRKVRTMVVRADGTLVEQEVTAPVQQAAAAPVAAAEKVSEKVAAQPALAEPAAAAKPAAVAAAPVSAPVAPAAPAKVVSASLPATSAPRPVEQPEVVGSVSNRPSVPLQTAAPARPAVTAPTEVASVGPGGYFIQVASLPTQADAQKSYQNLSIKFGNVIAGRGVDIKAAEIAGKGTFYRVRIPAGSKEQAVQLCERYRSAGGSCLVAR